MIEGSPEALPFEAAFRNAAMGMALISPDGRFLQVNDALCRIVGYAPEELLDLDSQRCTHEDDLAADLAQRRRLLEGEIRSFELEQRCVHRDGHTIWVALTMSLAHDEGGKPWFFVAQLRDVTEHHQADAETRPFFEQSLDLLAIASLEGKLTRVNHAWAKALGYDAAEVTSRPFLDFVHADDQQRTMQALEELRKGRPVREFRNRYRAKDGSYHWLDWNVQPGADGLLFCVARDVTGQALQDHALHLRDRALASVSNGIVITDARLPDNPVIYLNPAFTRITGYTEEDAIARNCRFLQNEDRDQPDLARLREAVAAGTECRVVLRNYRKDGRQFLNELAIAPVQDSAGVTTHFVGVIEDITERVKLEEQIRQASQLDEMTGLYNRRGFFLLGEQALRAALRHERHLLLCYVDLDGLKQVNDDLGHDQGDQAILDTSTLLKHVFRHSDIVARIGGDEFVALAEGDFAAEPSLRQRIGDEIKRHNDTADRPYRLSASVGVAYFNPRKATSLGELLKQADHAMYERKKRLRSSIPLKGP